MADFTADIKNFEDLVLLINSIVVKNASYNTAGQDIVDDVVNVAHVDTIAQHTEIYLNRSPATQARVKTGDSLMLAVSVENANASKAYLFLYASTLIGQQPLEIIPLPANSITIRDAVFYKSGLFFKRGIYYSLSSSKTSFMPFATPTDFLISIITKK